MKFLMYSLAGLSLLFWAGCAVNLALGAFASDVGRILAGLAGCYAAAALAKFFWSRRK